MVQRDTGYNSLLLNKNNPEIRDTLKKQSLSQAKQIPLKERLADAFSFMKHGDLIITGKNIKDSQQAMMESLGKLKNVIIRDFFIEDDNFNGTLGFTKNALNETEVINANPGR